MSALGRGGGSILTKFECEGGNICTGGKVPIAAGGPLAAAMSTAEFGPARVSGLGGSMFKSILGEGAVKEKLVELVTGWSSREVEVELVATKGGRTDVEVGITAFSSVPATMKWWTPLSKSEWDTELTKRGGSPDQNVIRRVKSETTDEEPEKKESSERGKKEKPKKETWKHKRHWW